MLRSLSLVFAFILVSCGGGAPSHVEETERYCLSLVESNAWAVDASFCGCAADTLSAKSEIHMDSVKRTLEVIVQENSESGQTLGEISQKLTAASKRPDADDRSVNLGTGIRLVEELIAETNTRLSAGDC